MMPYLEYELDEVKKKLELTSDREYYIGRDSKCAVALENMAKISRRHCVIYFNSNTSSYALADMYSTNGTLLNGRKIGHHDVLLRSGDEIQVGLVKFRFCIPESQTQTQPVRTKSTEIQTIAKAPLSMVKPSEKKNFESPFKVGDHLSNGVISAILSETAESALYLVTDRIGEKTAMKVFKGTPTDSSAGKDLAGIAAIIPETDTGLLPYTGAGSLDNGLCYYSIPYREEPSYALLISSMAPISEGRSLPLIYSAALILDKANRNGIIHGDLKPDKIFFIPRESNRILGCGIARWRRKYFPEDTMRPQQWYASPELTADEEITWQADLYSLGIIFFQMLTGVLPFRSDSPEELAHLHKEQPLPLLRDRNPQVDVSAVTAGILARMTMKETRHRYSSWDELLSALAKANSQLKNNHKTES